MFAGLFKKLMAVIIKTKFATFIESGASVVKLLFVVNLGDRGFNPTL